ncbi:hypothetical protein HK096_002637, partial [Nowakowskiella sp. JEL0078]
MKSLVQQSTRKGLFLMLHPIRRAFHANSTNLNINTVRDAEIVKFAAASQEWWDPHGQFGLLHTLNPVRVRYIRESVERNMSQVFLLDPSNPKPLKGLRILDIGCGGGLLTESLARLGGTVVGADAALENVKMARWHSLHDPNFSNGVEKLEADGEKFDMVIASEVIEHVANQTGFISACSALLKDDGMLFFSTINRTVISYLLTIVAAEQVLNIVPRGTHTHSQYVKPEEMEIWITDSGCKVLDVTGIALNPLIGKWHLIEKRTVCSANQKSIINFNAFRVFTHINQAWDVSGKISNIYVSKIDGSKLNVQNLNLSAETNSEPSVNNFRVLIGSWNMNGRYPDSELSNFVNIIEPFNLPQTTNLSLSKREIQYNLVVIGTQEQPRKLANYAVKSPPQGDWEKKLKNVIGEKYELLKCHSMGSLHLAIFVERRCRKKISEVEEGHVATGKSKVLGNKGSVAIGLNFDTHQNKVEKRNADFTRVSEELLNSGFFRCGIGQGSIFDKFEYVFCFGDLNYRVNEKRSTVDFLLSQNQIQTLLNHDQLLNELKLGTTFKNFNEAPITFPPTFKFDVPNKRSLKRTTQQPNSFNCAPVSNSQVDKFNPTLHSTSQLYSENNTHQMYDSSSKARVPSWTDRILYRCNAKYPNSDIISHGYTSCKYMYGSDHLP